MTATTTKSKSILVSDAAWQLGLTESEFRALLKGMYKNPKSVKQISQTNYQLIAETLKSRAESESEPVDEVDEVEETENTDEIQDTTIQAVTDIQSLDEENVEPSEPTESTSLATTDTQALDIPTEQAKLQLQLNLNLNNQVLDLNKITSALAVVAGEEVVKNFEEIYTHTVNTGINRVIQTVAGQTYETIQQLKEVNNSDFLAEKGRVITPIDTQSAIDQIMQFI